MPASSSFAEPLPEGEGIAASYPGDAGLMEHSSVVFVEDFESGKLDPVRWEDVRGRENIDIVSDHVHSGGHACRFTCDQQIDDATAKTWFMPGHKTIFVRWYVWFDQAIMGTSHVFSTPTSNIIDEKWQHRAGGGAGHRPIDSFWTTLEPVRKEGVPDPGVWGFYTYWPLMRSFQSDEGVGDTYYGNRFWPEPPVPVKPGRWICMEVMLKSNTPGQSDGEQACWVEGRLAARFGPGVPNGHWTRDVFHNDPDGEPFEGYEWRSREDVLINMYTMGLYQGPKKDGKAEISRIWYDDIVVATEYVGPQAE